MDSKEAIIEMESRQPQPAESEATEPQAIEMQPDHEVIQLTPEETAVGKLHVATEDGNLNEVKSLLLENAKERIESTMTKRIASAMPERDTSTDQYDIPKQYDTPVHKAAYKGFTKILEVFIKEDPGCVKSLCPTKKKHIGRVATPLHAAVRGGHLDTLKLILKHVENSADVINALNLQNQTPLHLTVEAALDLPVEAMAIHLAKALLENDPPADINGVTEEEDETDGSTSDFQRTPFHQAICHGTPELAVFLLEKGASVSPQALSDAINEGYEDIIKSIIKNKRGYQALHCVYEHHGENTTPFRDLIRKMPDIAEIVLDKCIDYDPKNNDDNDKNFNVLMNYEFVEDGRQIQSSTTTTQSLDSPKTHTKEHTSSQKQSAPEQWPLYEQMKKNPDIYGPQYGVAAKSMKEHPLYLMAYYNHEKLLNHPVVESLVYLRWTRYGLWCYLLGFFINILFLIFLTSYALVVPNPLNPMDCFSPNLTCIDDRRQIFPSVAASLVIFLSLLQLLVESFLLAVQKHRYFFEIEKHPFRFFFKFHNWGQFILYPCSIIFVAMPNWMYPCVWPWQWQVGVLAVCLACFNFIWQMAKCPRVGLYVVMFFKIIKTFLELVLLMILLLVTFGLTFYMILSDPNLQRSPFSMPILSILKVLSMLTGEVDYDAIFRFDLSDENFTRNDFPYLPVAYIIWIPFLIIMPLLFSNLLTGVAVSDANEIIKNAKSTQRGLIIQFLLFVEEILPKRLKKQLLNSYPKELRALKPIYPNKEVNRSLLLWLLLRWIPGWGGIICYNKDVIRHVLIRKESLDEKEQGDVKSSTTKLKKHISDKTDGLVKQVDTMKEEIQSIKLLLIELAKKNGIDPDAIATESSTDPDTIAAESSTDYF